MMKVNMQSHQRGFELGQFLVVAVVLVFVAITGMRLIPAYMEDNSIKHIFAAIAHDPDMQSAPPSEIQKAFDIRASVDDIEAIKASDIEISRSGGGNLYLSASYAVKIPLVANVSFYLEFNPTSEK